MKIKDLILILIPIALLGCSTTPDVPGDTNEVEVSLKRPELPRSEVRALKTRAEQGDANAAWELYVNYAFADYNESLSERFFNRAIELEHPSALYEKAFWIWTREEFPDIETVEALARRAIELGYNDEKGLLDEIVAARESGTIPRRSRLRLFPEKVSD